MNASDNPTSESPYAPDSPWPCMRADVRNTGCAPRLRNRPAAPGEDRMRRWSTGNGIFSTPVIGADETIYVGSADKHFYAFDPVSGEKRWSFPTGECIDSAGCIAADGTLYFASCDAGLYGLSPSGDERWRLNLFENRRHFTPSTIFWWEGNVVLGPNGLLYAGNDDFNFYAIEPGRGVRWAYLTGLHIWTAPAFTDDGGVCFLSFDRNCYLLDRETGRQRWRTNTGNFVVSSPAIGDDGTIYFGSFDRHVYALDGSTGRVRWRTSTQGPIYASPALAPDGTIYIGSSDGCLYALDGGSGSVRWSFYTGDAIRASASIGPDPENSAAYLVYFGSGNGRLYAVDPGGRRRWSNSTCAEGAALDSPNINASIALGRRGVAAATASGHVVYVPYDYYRSQTDDAALDSEPGDGFPRSGVFLYALSPGGAMEPIPSDTEAAPRPWEPSQPISLRLLARVNGQTRGAQFEPDGIDVTCESTFPLRVTLQPDGTQVNVIPVEPVREGSTVTLRVRARCRIDGDNAAWVESQMRLQPVPAANPPPLEELIHLPFRITHMSLYDPAIVPSFDQIGIASLTIQVRVVDVDPTTGRVVAWGVEKFGMEDDGDATQVAIPRHLFYAFGGTYRDGRLLLEARDCSFELTAFPAPLDLLRLSGTWADEDGPRVGSSLVAELDVAARLRPRRQAGVRRLGRPTQSWWTQVVGFTRRWIPDGSSAFTTLPLMLRLLARAVPLGIQVVRRATYGPWGLISEDGWFRGVGSFRSRADVPLDGGQFRVRQFDYEAANRKIVATIEVAEVGEPNWRSALPGIVVVDLSTHQPIPLRYTSALTIRREDNTISVALALPRQPPDRWRAHLLLDSTPLAAIDLPASAQARDDGG